MITVINLFSPIIVYLSMPAVSVCTILAEPCCVLCHNQQSHHQLAMLALVSTKCGMDSHVTLVLCIIDQLVPAGRMH